MQFDKPPTTVDEQARQLISRGINCDDEAVIRAHLNQIGYYRLSAYWLPFEEPPIAGQTRSKTFRAGTHFSEIIALYEFDRKLRLLIMGAVERIEIAARTNWINEFTLSTKTAHPHLDAANFRDQREHTRLLARLYVTIDQSSELFIKHYQGKYTSPNMPPLWAVCEAMSFGSLSKWVAATKDKAVNRRVARSLGLPAADLLIGVLETLTYIRNICAHHNRLWNRRFVKRMPFIQKFEHDIIVTTNNSKGQTQPENLMFNILAVILIILNHLSMSAHFKSDLIKLIRSISDGQRTAMGFPIDWQTRPAWI